MDADGNPVGLSSTLTTGAAGSGTLTVTLRHEPMKSATGVTLRHEPMKSATGVADGDITNAGGETDIEIVFPVDVQ